MRCTIYNQRPSYPASSSVHINGITRKPGNMEVVGDASDLMSTVQTASQIPEGPVRDAALLSALRECRKALEDAESESHAAQLRLSDAKETFDAAVKLLSGADPSSLPIFDDGAGSASGSDAAGGENRGASSADGHQYHKRAKAENFGGQDAASASTTPEPPGLPLPTNPIRAPAVHTSVVAHDGILEMSEEDVATHRENFYQKLLNTSASEVESYTPTVSNANLRSKAQLDEGVYIVKHWDTGVDGMDPAIFRSKHKSWYTKMKPVTYSIGRRTGIHVRTLDSGEEVLCRYNKEGTKSTMYLAASQLYDAFFELHCLELNHARGHSALKLKADDLYANIPEGQTKVFVDTCPICIRRRGKA